MPKSFLSSPKTSEIRNKAIAHLEEWDYKGLPEQFCMEHLAILEEQEKRLEKANADFLKSEADLREREAKMQDLEYQIQRTNQEFKKQLLDATSSLRRCEERIEKALETLAAIQRCTHLREVYPLAKIAREQLEGKNLSSEKASPKQPSSRKLDQEVDSVELRQECREDQMNHDQEPKEGSP
jgi:hypothetical protein